MERDEYTDSETLSDFDALDPTREWEPLIALNSDDLLCKLTELVSGLLQEPGSYAIICRAENRFVQVGVEEHGEICAETVSNLYLDEVERLSVDDEAHLISLGWLAPDPEHPNWWRELDAAPWPAPLAAALCGRTLLDVHDVHGRTLGVSIGSFTRPAGRALPCLCCGQDVYGVSRETISVVCPYCAHECSGVECTKPEQSKAEDGAA